MSRPRKNIMLGTAGHVDHGKTALVRLLTGCETDTLVEEKKRGLTIELGYAPCQLADQRIVGIVDVPGHVDFIRNMAAGAHGIDLVLFVVAADDGIMPQTHEHLHILTLMGLEHGLVALTKIDLVEPPRRQAVLQDLRRLLSGTFLQSAPICPISNLTGEGFDAFFDALNQVVNACADRPCSGLFRVWIDDVFSIRGSGTIVTGIALSGTVRVGDRLTLLPPQETGRVRRLQVYGEEATEGRAGECVALNLPELSPGQAQRGMVLCQTASLPAVSMAEAQLHILPSVKGAIDDYLDVQLHIGTAVAQTRLAMLETHSMTGGHSQKVQLRLAKPLPLVPGERFVIRANRPGASAGGLTTIGGGRILGTSNVRLRRKRPWTLQSLEARLQALDDPMRWCELVLSEQASPLSLPDLGRLARLPDAETRSVLESLLTQGRVQQTASGGFAHADSVARIRDGILAALQAFHQAHPDRAGLEREPLRTTLHAHPDLFHLALHTLCQANQVEDNGTVLALPGCHARLADSDQRLCGQIAEAFRQAGWTGPAAADLAAQFQEPIPRVETMIRLLQERGLLVRLDARLTIHRDALAAAQHVVLRLFSRAASFSTMEFRDALGVSRKYAVPLLDHLDRLRFTVRSGNNRTPGAEAKKRMPRAD